MADEQKTKLRLEIAHVLFIDIVGYSKLSIDEQQASIDRLNEVVQSTDEFRKAEAAHRLVKIPTGDGMALVFYDSPETPVECALEISRALAGSRLAVRMGINSGPVSGVVDVNGRANVAGEGINLAQRVMDCGDVGHILLSQRVADDLAQFKHWRPHLHDIGECEVKHGKRISLVNLFTSEVGNSDRPIKLECTPITGTAVPGAVAAEHGRAAWWWFAVAMLVVAGIAALFLWRGRDRSTARPNVSEKSIAVLPFENVSNDPSAEYLSEGISEALINSLTELQQLRVIARTTAFHYRGKEIDPKRVGRELNVAAVLTGKVRQMQDALNVQVDLVDAATGAQLWGAGYDRKLSDVIAVKQAIAREVAEKLKLKLSGEEARRLTKRDTNNPEAYQFYLRGRYFGNRRTPESLKQAIQEFQQAIERDPSFALGYSGVADSYLLLQQYAGVPSSEAMPKARAAADRALQIDDSLAEAHTSSAATHQFAWQWARAEQEFRRATSLNDNYATGHHWFCVYFEVQRQWDEALREIKRAQELDPLSSIIAANFALIYLINNDVKAALEQCEKIITLEPNHISGHDWLGWVLFKQGHLEEAIREREKVAELSQRASPQLGSVGYVYAVAGRQEEAQAILKELEQRYAKGEAIGQYLAMVCEGLGDRDQAFAWLEKDFQQQSAELQFTTWRVQFEHLRHDPRYIDLIRRMGLNP